MSLAHNHHHHAHGDLTKKAAIASVSMALFLLALKIFAAAETGSVALLGSLADTAFDVLASLLTLFSVRYAAMPADDDHRFGHHGVLRVCLRGQLRRLRVLLHQRALSSDVAGPA